MRLPLPRALLRIATLRISKEPLPLRADEQVGCLGAQGAPFRLRRNSPQPLAQPPLTNATTRVRCLTRTTSTPPRGRVQPGAGFDPLRGVTRLQPYLRAGPRQLKPAYALGGK